MKEAVVLILDANSSMATPSSSGSAGENTNRTSKSRFDCAKQVAMDMISDLTIRSKTNEVAVLVLKSPTTRHHFWEPNDADADADDGDGDDGDDDGDDDDKDKNREDGQIPFPNLLELGGDGLTTGVNRVHPDLLRQLQTLQVTDNSHKLRGDFCDGIVVAADALYKRTATKKYQRRIVLITDAEHKVQVDGNQLLVVLDSLRAMECRLEVIGMDFDQHAEYAQAAAAPTVKEELGGDNAVNGDDNMNIETEEEDSATDVSDTDDDDEEDPSDVKRQNEQLLMSLTEKTGGFVMAAKELQPILQKVLGQRRPQSTRRKVHFQIAPGLVLEARFSLLLSKATTPTLKQQVVQLEEGETADDPDAKVQRDALGQELTHDIQTLYTHWDPEQDTQEITDIAHAYKYGSDLVPMSGLDMIGLLHTSPVQLTLLGYLPEADVPRCYRVGPPYALAGAASQRTCAAIAVLAQTLRAKQHVGIATLVKTKDADPILVGLFPLEDGDRPTHLCLLQLPFQGDVTQLQQAPLVHAATAGSKAQAADALVDALLLPDHVLDHTQIPNPYLRSFHQTVVQRVLNPKCPIVSVRPTTTNGEEEEQDLMATPSANLAQAKPALEAFRAAFPLTRSTMTSKSSGGRANQGRRRGPVSYHDFVEPSRS